MEICRLNGIRGDCDLLRKLQDIAGGWIQIRGSEIRLNPVSELIVVDLVTQILSMCLDSVPTGVNPRNHRGDHLSLGAA